jgi:hypothetical protein
MTLRRGYPSHYIWAVDEVRELGETGSRNLAVKNGDVHDAFRNVCKVCRTTSKQEDESATTRVLAVDDVERAETSRPPL